MDRVCVELDEVKAELEKLRFEYKSKSELFDNLRKAHNEQLTKGHEASSKIEKQAQELNENAEKIATVEQMCEDLRGSLRDKESMVQHLRAANDKLRVDCAEKCRKLEEANEGLRLSLDEANAKRMDEEDRIGAYKEEIRGLKARLLDSEKKCLEVERKCDASKEIREREEVILRVEEENRRVLDELKWKKEQFQHLEEAHEKLRDKFKECENEWEREKCSLVDEICSLETNLESQTRVSDDLQKQLQMCNQALAHEESRRKCVEAQVSEFQTRFTSAFSDSDDAKSQQECTERDREIASLRQSLSTKATLQKEMDYQARRLQQENEELRMLVKELQEAQIQSAPGSPSLAKMRSKIKRLEQMNGDLVAEHRAKEAEWSSQLENMTGELNKYKSELENKDATIAELRLELEQMKRNLTSDLSRSKEYECSFQLELESKDATIDELTKELEACHSLTLQLELENKELSVMLLVLKLGISEAELKISNEKSEMAMNQKEKEECISLLWQQLEMKNAALVISQAGVEQEREKAAAVLSRKIEASDLIEKEKLLMQEELNRYKEMLEDSSKHELCLKQKILEIESILERECREVNEALESKDAAINELKMELEACHSLTSQLELENEELSIMLLVLKLGISDAELKILNEKSEMAVHEKEKEEYIDLLRQQLEMKNAALVIAEAGVEEESEKGVLLSRRIEALDLIEKEKQEELDRYKEMLEDSSKHELCLRQQLLEIENVLERECRDVNEALERANAEMAEKNSEVSDVEMELHIWKYITENLRSDLEVSLGVRKELEASLLAEIDVGESIKQENKDLLYVLEEKNRTVEILQQKIVLLEKKLKRTERVGSAQTEEKLQTEVRRLEQIGAERQNRLNDLVEVVKAKEMEVQKLKSERRNVLEDVIKLLSESFSADKQLKGMLEEMLLSFENQGLGMDLELSDELVDAEKENVSTPATMKKCEAVSDIRSPFRDLNT